MASKSWRALYHSRYQDSRSGWNQIGRKKKGTMELALIENFCISQVLQILMIYEYLNWKTCAFQVMMPFFKGGFDGQQLALVGWGAYIVKAALSLSPTLGARFNPCISAWGGSLHLPDPGAAGNRFSLQHSLREPYGLSYLVPLLPGLLGAFQNLKNRLHVRMFQSLHLLTLLTQLLLRKCIFALERVGLRLVLQWGHLQYVPPSVGHTAHPTPSFLDQMPNMLPAESNMLTRGK